MYKLADKLEYVLKPILKKNNKYPIFRLIMHWRNIVGEKYYDHCYPKRIVYSGVKGKQKKVLELKVSNGALAHSISYIKGSFIERINDYLGERIDEIKIIQTYDDNLFKPTENEEVKHIDEERQQDMYKLVEDIEDEELKALLKDLADNIAAR